MEEKSAVKEYKLGYSFAKKHGVVISNINMDQSGLEPTSVDIVCRDQVCSPDIAMEIKRYLGGLPINIEVLPKLQFNSILDRKYGGSSVLEAKSMMQNIEEDMDLSSFAENLPTTQDLLESQDDAPVIKLINVLLTQAIKQDASDIHIETYEEKIVIRFRIDGVLRVVLEPQRALAPIITSRIKVMARLDIAERRLPQDGRIALRIAGREVDLRVSTIPTTYGERIVMRILDKQAGKLDMNHLGMDKALLTNIYKLLESPYGIILVTGPTGSGKSTSLYSMLTVLNKSTRNILTVEDPVEYNIEGIGQTQVNTKVDMSFAKGLRAILRQDPDIVMVGEIRDLETVEVSIQASLTGHLVLSTLHTNTAVGAITRLRDMGVEPFLLSSSIIAVFAQRLVRVLCKQCRKEVVADKQSCKILGVDFNKPPKIFFPGNYGVEVAADYSCEACTSTGYRERTGIYELVLINEKMRQLIHDGAEEKELELEARKATPSISQDGIKKVLAGVTSIEEVLRVTNIANDEDE